MKDLNVEIPYAAEAIVDEVRHLFSYCDLIAPSYLLLYCKKMGYACSFGGSDFVESISVTDAENSVVKDMIVSEFVEFGKDVYSKWRTDSVNYLFHMIDEVIEEDDYHDTLMNLANYLLINFDHLEEGYDLMPNFTELIDEICRLYNPKSVFNPYCGYGHDINLALDHEYTGMESDPTMCMVARIRFHEMGMDPSRIMFGNPLENEISERYDLLVSKTPLGIIDKIHVAAADELWNGEIDHLLLTRFLMARSCRKAILSFPSDYFRKGHSLTFRKIMVAHNWIEAFIDLPSGMSGSRTIIIINKDKTENATRFINASECFHNEYSSSFRVLDKDKIICLLSQTEESDEVLLIDQSEFEENNYAFAFFDYFLSRSSVIPEGHVSFEFTDVFDFTGKNKTPVEKGMSVSRIQASDFSDDILSVYSGCSPAVNDEPVRRFYKSKRNVSVAIRTDRDSLKMAKLKEPAMVDCCTVTLPLSFRDDSPVDLDYALMYLLNTDAFIGLPRHDSGTYSFTAAVLKRRLRNFPIVAPPDKNLQRQLVKAKIERLKIERQDRLKEELRKYGPYNVVWIGEYTVGSEDVSNHNNINILKRFKTGKDFEDFVKDAVGKSYVANNVDAVIVSVMTGKDQSSPDSADEMASLYTVLGIKNYFDYTDGMSVPFYILASDLEVLERNVPQYILKEFHEKSRLFNIEQMSDMCREIVRVVDDAASPSSKVRRRYKTALQKAATIYGIDGELLDVLVRYEKDSLVNLKDLPNKLRRVVEKVLEDGRGKGLYPDVTLNDYARFLLNTYKDFEWEGGFECPKSLGTAVKYLVDMTQDGSHVAGFQGYIDSTNDQFLLMSLIHIALRLCEWHHDMAERFSGKDKTYRERTYVEGKVVASKDGKKLFCDGHEVQLPEWRPKKGDKLRYSPGLCVELSTKKHDMILVDGQDIEVTTRLLSKDYTIERQDKNKR